MKVKYPDAMDIGQMHQKAAFSPTLGSWGDQQKAEGLASANDLPGGPGNKQITISPARLHACLSRDPFGEGPDTGGPQSFIRPPSPPAF